MKSISTEQTRSEIPVYKGDLSCIKLENVGQTEYFDEMIRNHNKKDSVCIHPILFITIKGSLRRNKSAEETPNGMHKVAWLKQMIWQGLIYNLQEEAAWCMLLVCLNHKPGHVAGATMLHIWDQNTAWFLIRFQSRKKMGQINVHAVVSIEPQK